MICRNCGSENPPTDAFCGACGHFLGQPTAASGTPPPAGGAAGPGGAGDETAAYEPYAPPDGLSAPPEQRAGPPPGSPRANRHQARPPRYEAGARMARPTQAGVTYGAIACWNCGRRNPGTRAFCQQCGERLSVSSLPGAHEEWEGGGSGGRAKMVAIALGALAVLLLAGGVAAVLLNGPEPGPTPTGAAVVTDSPPPLTPGPTLAPPTIEPTLPPTEPPTEPPTAEPTAGPTEAPPTPPPATPVNCASSSVPTQWVNLSGADGRARVRRDEAWCIHQVIVVPDPLFGAGRIRLVANDRAIVDVTHDPASGDTEYPVVFEPAQLVVGRQDVRFRMNCPSEPCNAVIQVGYELLDQP